MRDSRLFICLLFALVVPAGAVEFHVAPGGSDSADGSKAHPVATMAGARDAVRAWRARSTTPETVTVWLHTGGYRLTEPVVFTPQDSGTLEHPVIYRSVPGAKAVISGGRFVQNWRRQGKQLWVADVPWAKPLTAPFTQHFVNGKRRVRARTPNDGKYLYTRRLLYDDRNNPYPQCDGLTFNEGDLKPWDQDEDALICLFHNWVNSYNRVGKADWTRHRLDFARPAGIFFLSPNVRYYVENLRSALDAPGEWYLDHKAGLLYYYPVPGENMAKAEVIAPVVKQTLLELRGVPESGNYVQNLQFRDLSFQHTDAELSPGYRHSVQGAETQRGAIVARGARNCVIDECEFTRLGEHGVSLLEGCSGNTVSRCRISDTGGGGIYLSEAGPANTAEWFLTAHNTIDNNFIHDGGKVFRAGCGVFLGGSASYNRITHNEICDLSWMGVHMGWSWTAKNPAYTHHNEIAYNHIHHIGNGVLNDIGGIYTLGVSAGTVIHHNLIHDITRFERGEEGYGGWGIYLDAASSEIRVENNVVYNTRDGGLHLHSFGYPYGDEIVNNVFAYAGAGQLVRNNTEETESSHAVLEHNIVYNSNGRMFDGDNWTAKGKFSADYNCYFSEKTTSPDFYGLNFAGWQATGRDTHSLVADPWFMNARKHDFRLKPNSPALKLGIQPIDLSTVGLYGDAAWTKLPTKISHQAVEKGPKPDPNTQGLLQYDFEEYDSGDIPDGAVPPDGATSCSVTDESPASGAYCLKFVDGPSQDVWKPHWFIKRIPMKGAVHLQAKLRNDPLHPVVVELELRDWPGMIGAKYATGPYLRLMPDGTVQASDGGVMKPIGHCSSGEWLTVNVRFSEGKGRANSYSVTLGPDGASVSGLKFVSEGFTNFNWLGVMGTDKQPGAFYLDDVVVGRD
ncbi:MAG: right-handed parallel beta-helix repeat-containing protein [Armatimonadota bacterium]